MKIKIGLIFDCFPPEIVGGSIRAYSFCRYLTKFGHEVFVVTKKQLGGMMRTSRGDFPIPDNCHVYKNYGKSMSFIFPGFGYLPLFLLSALKICRKYDISLIHGSMPSPVGAVTGYLASKITGKPFVLEIRDPWVRAVDIDAKVYSHAYVDPTKGYGKYLCKLEEKMCEHANAIVVTNPAIKDEILNVHPSLSVDKFRVIYNAADLDDFENVEPTKFDRFTVLYSGVIYKGRGMGELIKAMEHVEDGQLLITGGGPKSELKEFLSYIEKKNLSEKVKYLGVIPNDELYPHYLGADVLFAGLDMSEMNKYLLPSKIFNYMAAGKPIVATGITGGDLDMIVRKYKCGIMINSVNPEEIAEAIELLKDKKLAQKLGDNGRKAVEKEFNREKQTRELIKVYEEAIG